MAYLTDQQGPRARQLYIFKPSGAQSVFTGLDSQGYALRLVASPLMTSVYVNGYMLAPEDWSGNNAGDTLTIAKALGAGDILVISSEAAFGVADALRISQNGQDIADKPLFRQNLGLRWRTLEVFAPTVDTQIFAFSVPDDVRLLRISGKAFPSLSDSNLILQGSLNGGTTLDDGAGAYVNSFNWMRTTTYEYLANQPANYSLVIAGSNASVPSIFTYVCDLGYAGLAMMAQTFGVTTTSGGVGYNTVGQTRTANGGRRNWLRLFWLTGNHRGNLTYITVEGAS